jgi:hypothetical protein
MAAQNQSLNELVKFIEGNEVEMVQGLDFDEF